MKAFVLSTLVATLVGTAVGTLMWQYNLGSHVWHAHANLCALFATLLATFVSQWFWSPAYFKRRA